VNFDIGLRRDSCNPFDAMYAIRFGDCKRLAHLQI